MTTETECPVRPDGRSTLDEPADELAQVLCAAHAMADAQKSRRLDLDRDNVRKGLGQLVLTLVRLLLELLERQALRRMEGGSMTERQIEEVGYTLMRQSEEISRLAREFELSETDLNLDLGALGRLL